MVFADTLHKHLLCSPPDFFHVERGQKFSGGWSGGEHFAPGLLPHFSLKPIQPDPTLRVPTL